MDINIYIYIYNHTWFFKIFQMSTSFVIISQYSQFTNQSSYTKHLCYLDLLFLSCFRKNNCNLLKAKYFLIYVFFKINMVFKLNVSIHNFSQYLHTHLGLSKNLFSFLMPTLRLIQNKTSYIKWQWVHYCHCFVSFKTLNPVSMVGGEDLCSCRQGLNRTLITLELELQMLLDADSFDGQNSGPLQEYHTHLLAELSLHSQTGSL